MGAAMNVQAWCGHCGESFRLVEVIEDGAGATCPRCGFLFDPGYSTLLASAVRQFVAAADELQDAARLLREVAPLLHVDRKALYADLDTELDR